MANISYKVPCPSCEAEVPIRSSASIGKKIECPKCKYRFTVPEPPDEDGDKKGKKGGKKDATKKKAKSPMLLVGILLGVLAVGALAVGGYMLMADDTPSASNTKSGGGGGTAPPVPAGGGNSSTPTIGRGDTGTPEGTGATGTQPNPVDGGTTPTGTQPPPAGATGETPMTPPTPAPTGPGADVTNLLPGETVAVYRVNFDPLARNAQPLSVALFDANMRDLLANALAVKAEDLQTYIHCVVNPVDRDTFGVIKTKNPVNRPQMYNRVKMEKATNSPIKGRDLFVIKANAFIDALGSSLTPKTLVSLTGLPIPVPEARPSAKKYALCVYDDHTVLIGTELVVERFLGDLQENGYPAYKSDLTPDAPADGSTPAEGTPPAGPAGGPPGRGAPPAGRGGPPGGASLLLPRDWSRPHDGVLAVQLQPLAPPGSPAGGQPPTPGGPPPGTPLPPGVGGQPPAAAGQGAAGRRVFTAVPTYRTVVPPLKMMLNHLEPDDANPPVFVYAELIDQRTLSAYSLADVAKGSESLVAGLLQKVKVVGLALNKFNKEKLEAVAAAEYVSADDARSSARGEITPLLNLGKVVMDGMLGTRTTVRSGGQNGGNAGGPFAGGPPTGGLPPIGVIGGGPRGGTGGPPPGAPLPPGVGGGPRGGGGPPTGPPGGTPLPPGVGGGGQGPGGGGGTDDPVGGGFPAGGQPAAGNTAGDSTIDVEQSDLLVTVTVSMTWTDEKFFKDINPRVVRLAGQLKGRMAVLSGETDYYSLAVVAGTLKARQTAFPKGTLDREVVEQRYRLPYPPEQRVSFFAELLPFLGKGGIRAQVNEKKSWYAAENLTAAENWVPEFLVPYYPQDSWRATNPMAPGRVLGATNYAAPAGLGLDAARLNPSDPAHAKLVGITGYDWGSKPEDVKDGLSNTIYLLQLPPGQGRPWIAGGGSSVIGIDDQAADPLREFVHKTPTGARGTYVLMADGSVRFLKEGTDPKVFKGMITRAGGETLGDLDTLAPKQKPTRAIDGELRAGSPTGGGSTPVGATTGDTPPPAPKTVLNVDELKKFQGRWKATLVSNAGVVIPADKLAELKMEVVFDGAKVSMSGTGVPTQSDEVVKIDVAAAPKQMDLKDGATGKTQLLVYEFVGDGKVRIRSGEPGTPRPTTLGPTETGSKDTYVELERAGK